MTTVTDAVVSFHTLQPLFTVAKLNLTSVQPVDISRLASGIFAPGELPISASVVFRSVNVSHVSY